MPWSETKRRYVHHKTPDVIRRGGVVYRKDFAAKYDDVVEKLIADSDPMHFPPPVMAGERPSAKQREVLHQIKSAPRPVHWSGMEWGDSPVVIAYAPPLNSATMRALWKKGLIARSRQEGFIEVSARGERYLIPSRLAYEELRWQAIGVISGEMLLEKQRWLDSGYAGPTPLRQAPRARIRAKMRAIYDARKLAS